MKPPEDRTGLIFMDMRGSGLLWVFYQYAPEGVSLVSYDDFLLARVGQLQKVTVMKVYSHGWLHYRPVPAISIRQPWAWLLAKGIKDVENRTRWNYKHRGPVLLHASSAKDKEAEREARDQLREMQREQYAFFFEDLSRGGIVGMANLADVVDDYLSPWAWARHRHLVLNKCRELPFVPCKGRLGLFWPRVNLEEVGL